MLFIVFSHAEATKLDPSWAAAIYMPPRSAPGEMVIGVSEVLDRKHRGNHWVEALREEGLGEGEARGGPGGGGGGHQMVRARGGMGQKNH